MLKIKTGTAVAGAIVAGACLGAVFTALPAVGKGGAVGQQSHVGEHSHAHGPVGDHSHPVQGPKH